MTDDKWFNRRTASRLFVLGGGAAGYSYAPLVAITTAVLLKILGLLAVVVGP